MLTQDKYIRDKNNQGAVINTDNAALRAYKAQKQKFREIDALKEEVNDIKKMLVDILSHLKGQSTT